MSSINSTVKWSFDIPQWAAWSPNIHSAAQWQTWACAPYTPKGDDVPASEAVAPLLRRRLNRMTRMVYEVVSAIPNSSLMRHIYCSRHGDLQRTHGLLVQLAQNEPLSSMHFGLSVHNAVAGNISILQNNMQPMTSLAAMDQGVMCALIEALAQSHAINEPVLLVVYDDAVPDAFDADLVYDKDTAFAYALVIQIGNQFSVQQECTLTPAIESWKGQTMNIEPISPELQFLAWFLNDNTSKWMYPSLSGQVWCWSKYDA